MEPLLENQNNTSAFLNGYSQFKRFSSELNAYYKTLFITSCTFLALGTVENILVCLVLSKTYKVRSTQASTKLSSFFILQLAITDLVFRAVRFFHRASARHIEQTPEHCKTAIFSQFTCAAVSFVLLSGIAMDRYVHILFPIRSLSIKTRKCLIMLLIWIYAMIICSGFIVSATDSGKLFNFYQRRRSSFQSFLNSTRNNTSTWDYKEPRKHCTPGFSGSLERKVAFTIYFLFAFVVPLFCIVFCYTKITVFLWRKTKTNNSVNSSIARAKLRAIQMFALVVFSFLISWGPVMILDMVTSYPAKPGKIIFRKFPLRPLFDCISQTSSIFNPIIYAFGDASFRRSLYSLFCGRKRGRLEFTRVSPAKMRGAYIQMTNFTPRAP